jgi:hypothetical protein
VFRVAAPRDRVALLRCIAWWILHYAQCSRSANSELAQLVREAEVDEIPVEPECMAVLREGFPPDPPLAVPGAGSDAPPAIDLFPSERRRKTMDDIGWFLSLDPTDVATQLTLLDASLLNMIGPDEFRVQTRYFAAGVLVVVAFSLLFARAITRMRCCHCLNPTLAPGQPSTHSFVATAEHRNLFFFFSLTNIHHFLLTINHHTRAGQKGQMVLSPLGTAIMHTNKLTTQLVGLVLAYPTPEQRVAVIEHIIDVAKNLMELNNFASLFAMCVTKFLLVLCLVKLCMRVELGTGGRRRGTVVDIRLWVIVM